VKQARPALDLTRARKDPDAWWTVLVIDPLAMRLLPLLVPWRAVTPNGLSLGSLAFAAVAGAAFLDGRFWLGALLFELHFLLDCLDGKLARLRGIQSPRGGFLDLACDLFGTAWCFGALGVVALEHTRVPTLALLPAALYVVYTWSTLHRAQGGTLGLKRARSGVTGWLASHRMGPLPYGVEVEALTLFLLPLTGHLTTIRTGLGVAAAFFLVAALRNVRATFRGMPVAK
jgi:phosphatidylglycerophosphate synthase